MVCYYEIIHKRGDENYFTLVNSDEFENRLSGRTGSSSWIKKYATAKEYIPPADKIEGRRISKYCDDELLELLEENYEVIAK